MKIYLARHGQSRWQVQRDHRDWDSPLTELGHQQAQRLGEWLAVRPSIDALTGPIEIAEIVTSPLQRARQTAGYVGECLNIPVQSNAFLKEARFLVSAHLPQKGFPFGRKILSPRPSGMYYAFRAQASQALQDLVAAAEVADGPVLSVAHGGLISTMLRLALDSDAVSFWIYNTSLNLLEWKRGRWHLVHLNLWDHLSPEMRTF